MHIDTRTVRLVRQLALLITAAVILPASLGAQSSLKLTGGEVLEPVDLLKWVGDTLFIRRAGRIERLKRQAIAAIVPKDSWEAARLAIHQAKVKAQSDRAMALKLIDEGISHAATGADRAQLVADRAQLLMASGRLFDAWQSSREAPDAALDESILVAARKRMAELNELLGRTNDISLRRPLQVERFTLLSIADIDGDAPTASKELLDEALAESRRMAESAKVSLCERCSGKCRLRCPGCGGSGRGERSRFGTGKCSKCVGSGSILCGGCGASGLVLAELPEEMRRAMTGYMQELRRARSADVVPGLLLEKQVFVPPSVPSEKDGAHAMIAATLIHGRKHDTAAEVLPLRRGQWPSDPFDRARASFVTVAQLASEPTRYGQRWLTFVAPLGAVSDVESPWPVRRLNLGLPMQVIAHTEAGFTRTQNELEGAARAAGGLGAPLLAWLKAYPTRAVNGQVAGLTAGQWVYVSGRLQVPPESRPDLCLVFEAWDVGAVAEALPTK